MEHIINEKGDVETTLSPTDAIYVLRQRLVPHVIDIENRYEIEALFDTIMKAAVEGWKNKD